MSPQPSEFDLRPNERKLECGCYVERYGDQWRITGQAFLCPHDHRLQMLVAGETGASG